MLKYDNISLLRSFLMDMCFIFTFQLVAAKIMEMGPVLVINFQAQQIAYIADANGKVIEGNPVNNFIDFRGKIIVCFSFVSIFFRNKLIELIIFLHLVVIQLYLIL